MFGFTEANGSQLSFLLVGVWWFGFGQFSLRRLPKSIPAGTDNFQKNIFSKGYKELLKVWQQVKSLPILKRYLFAFFFYNMGVQTVMLAATLYGKSELEIPTTNLIIAILIIQLIAIPGAYLISGLSSRIGNFKALMLLFYYGLVFVSWDICCRKEVSMSFMDWLPWVVCDGGIQSLSRSTYAKLMPETKDTASFFSFYDVTEKIAIVIGMFSFGFINELTGSQRSSVLALMVYFIIGLLLLFYAATAKKKIA